jgi:single-strand DNA-binding protein
MSVNKSILIGHVGRDPEIRYTPDGKPVATFSLATNERWRDNQGQTKERTDWHRVETFGRHAEVVRDFVKKGRELYIEGVIRYDEWKDKEGNTRWSTRIRVSAPGPKVQLLGAKSSADPVAAPTPSDAPDMGGDDVPF